MRSLLPERRRANGHTLLEGAIAASHQALLARLGQEIDVRLRAATEQVLRRALSVVQQCRESQPEAVATLRRDFRAAIAAAQSGRVRRASRRAAASQSS